MKSNVLPAVLGLVLAAGAADAREPPNPPPSGIVIHLFGPGSLTANLLPAAGAKPLGNTAPAANAQPALSGAAAGGNSAQPNTSAAAPSPGVTDILHQMFVTGDPSLKPGTSFSHGKAGDAGAQN